MSHRDRSDLPEMMDAEETILVEAPLGGSNFLVSAVMMLKRQKKELQKEVEKLKAQVALLENQNAAFLNVSADRLLRR